MLLVQADGKYGKTRLQAPKAYVIVRGAKYDPASADRLLFGKHKITPGPDDEGQGSGIYAELVEPMPKDVGKHDTRLDVVLPEGVDDFRPTKDGKSWRVWIPLEKWNRVQVRYGDGPKGRVVMEGKLSYYSTDEILQLRKMKRVSDSHPIYSDVGGQQWHVLRSASLSRAETMVLSAEFYREDGIDTRKPRLIRFDNTYGLSGDIGLRRLRPAR